jgi:hypothetical protein
MGKRKKGTDGMMKTIMKETGGMFIEAQIHKYDTGYTIRYMINGEVTKTEQFDFSQPVAFVETAAKSWVNEMTVLNG